MKSKEEKIASLLSKYGIEFDERSCIIGSEPAVRFGELKAAMDEYAKEVAIEFMNWNAHYQIVGAELSFEKFKKEKGL